LNPDRTLDARRLSEFAGLPPANSHGAGSVIRSNVTRSGCRWTLHAPCEPDKADDHAAGMAHDL